MALALLVSFQKQKQDQKIDNVFAALILLKSKLRSHHSGCCTYRLKSKGSLIREKEKFVPIARTLARFLLSRFNYLLDNQRVVKHCLNNRRNENHKSRTGMFVINRKTTR